MSWIDKIQDSLIITTGDSKKYTPSWLNASFEVTYNVSEFAFRNLDGSLVDRGNPLGTRYSLEIHFQGDDHLDTALAFQKSAADKRAWVVEHPFYGILIVQPISLSFDNTGLNISKITGTIVETITQDNPKTTIDPIDSIRINKINLDTSLEIALTATPTPTDINTVTQNNKRNFNFSVPIIKLPEEFETYFNLFNEANSAVNTATASPLLAMRATLALISAPAMFAASVQSRINLLNDQFVSLSANLTTIVNVSSKQFYQNQGAGIISSMALAASIPLPGDYTNSRSVLAVIEIITAAYKAFLANLDSLQTPNGGAPDSFIPNADSMIKMNSLMNFAVSSLFNIAMGSKMERSIITENDTNIIILTHRLYGLDPSDANIDELIANNNIGLNGLLQIKKGTKIVYFI